MQGVLQIIKQHPHHLNLQCQSKNKDLRADTRLPAVPTTKFLQIKARPLQGIKLHNLLKYMGVLLSLSTSLREVTP